MKDRIAIITKAIQQYSAAYCELEKLQIEEESQPNRLLPRGDQKTGVCGEFYALLYARTQYGENACLADNHSQTGFDILAESSNEKKRIQVKTVSGFSKTRRTTPHHGVCDEIYYVSLDTKLNPDGFWIQQDAAQIHATQGKGKTIPRAATKTNLGKDRLSDLKKILTNYHL